MLAADILVKSHLGCFPQWQGLNHSHHFKHTANDFPIQWKVKWVSYLVDIYSILPNSSGPKSFVQLHAKQAKVSWVWIFMFTFGKSALKKPVSDKEHSQELVTVK